MSRPAEKMELFRRPVSVLSAELREGVISARDVLEHYLARIEQLNPKLNAFVFLDPQAAVHADDSDARLRAGRARGPLEGIPIAVKDNLWVKDMPAVWGSPLFSGHIASRDEVTIAKLRASGAVLIGKTNCPEFAMRGITSNAVFGATANPHDLKLTPGGSSGGAVAAVAAGLVPLSLATDGGGSIRRPAAHTGLVGLKPSVGRVRRGGGFPQLMHDFEVIGPVARDVAGVRLLFEAMSEPAPIWFRGGGSRILFVGSIDGAPVAPEITQSCKRAAQRVAELGHEVIHGDLPFSVDPVNAIWSEVSAVGLARLASNHARFHELASPDFSQQARIGSGISAADYAAKIELLLDFRVQAAKAFDKIDVIMTPTIAAQAWPLDQPYPAVIAGREVGPRGHAIFTGWVNAAGLPAIALPSEAVAGGLPTGFQLIGPAGADARLLNLAEAFAARYLVDTWPPLADENMLIP